MAYSFPRLSEINQVDRYIQKRWPFESFVIGMNGSIRHPLDSLGSRFYLVKKVALTGTY